MRQDSLFPEGEALQSKLIAKRKDFEGLFAGFTRLRAVSYVVSTDLLLEFLEKHHFESLEVVVGENLAQAYRQALAENGADAALRLARLLEEGRLRVYVPEGTIHTKLYLLEAPGRFRVIAASANLTETARQASRQMNYAWYADLPPGHSWLAQVERDYQAHRDRCALFLGDLAELLKKTEEPRRREVVEGWLREAPAEEVDAEARKLLREISRLATLPRTGSAEPVFSIKLPESPNSRRHVEKLLAPLDLAVQGNEMRVNGGRFLRYVQETHGIPMLRVDTEKRDLRLGLDGAVETLSEPLPEPAALGAALEELERYFATVDLGQALDPVFAKVSLFEGLLYMFSAPFAHEYMRLKRRRYGVIDTRGPRFLYIYGPSQNGKSTFLRYALRLIAGRTIEPLSGGDFAKRKILGAAAVGTAFPLAFDDLVLGTRYGLFEEVLKSYWESWWTEDGVSPQIVLSSNAYTLKDWAKSRVKRLDFDVQFPTDGRGKDALSALFRSENRIFRWFSPLYLDELSAPDALDEDELRPARRVFEGLYRRAGRASPEYFPAEPIEKRYDPGLKSWRDLTRRLKKAAIAWDHDRALVHFAEDLQYYEIKEYENSLPAWVKHRRRGKALVIETPKEFRAWLEGPAYPRGWWSRLFKTAAG